MNRPPTPIRKRKKLQQLDQNKLIEHILELQHYVDYTKRTNFYANNAATMPYRSLYSQTLLASEKLLAKLHNMPANNNEMKKSKTSQFVYLTTSPIKEKKKKKTISSTRPRPKSASHHHQSKNQSYNNHRNRILKKFHDKSMNKDIMRSNDGKNTFIFVTPKPPPTPETTKTTSIDMIVKKETKQTSGIINETNSSLNAEYWKCEYKKLIKTIDQNKKVFKKLNNEKVKLETKIITIENEKKAMLKKFAEMKNNFHNAKNEVKQLKKEAKKRNSIIKSSADISVENTKTKGTTDLLKKSMKINHVLHAIDDIKEEELNAKLRQAASERWKRAVKHVSKILCP